MRTFKSLALLLATVSLVVSAYPRYYYYDSVESLEEPDDVLNSLTADQHYIDYYKHYNQDIYQEPTQAQYDIAFEIMARRARRKKKQQSKNKNKKPYTGPYCFFRFCF